MRNTFKLSLSVFSLLFIFSSNLWAQAGGGSPKASVGAMLLFGTGKIGNSTDVKDRSMIHTPFILFAGYNIKKFRIGLNYEYALVGQSEDPANVNNQNLGGKMTSAGLRLEYYNGVQAFGLIYRLSDKMTLDKPTLAGTVADYTGSGSIGIQYYRQIKKKIGIVVDYSSGKLKSGASNSDDINWSRIGLGVVFTNFPGGR
jgi:hypothetical protein